MKIIFWVLVISAAVMLVRRYGALAAARARRDAQASAGKSVTGDGAARPGQADPDMMVACSVCNLHLPASEAIFAHGRVYCCEAHQAQGSRARPDGA